MIKKLRIHNFQSHKDSTLEFANGLNVIVGTSNHGKSAIVRALDWILRDSLRGSSFIRHGEKKVRVEVEFENGDKVSRHRTRTDGGEVVLDVKGAETAFTVGRGYPPEVVNFINMNDLNFQSQHDPAFLLADTSGEVSRRLNEIAGVEVIDRVLSHLNSEIRRLNQEIEHATDERERERALFQKYHNLTRDLKPLAEEEQRVESDLKKAIEDKRKLEGLVDEVRWATDILERLPNLKRAGRALEKAPALVNRIERVEKALSEIRRIARDVKEATSRLERLPDVSKAEAGLKRAEALAERRRETEEKISALRKAVRSAVRVGARLERIEEELGKARQEFKEAFPEVCPLCGQPVKELKV